MKLHIVVHITIVFLETYDFRGDAYAKSVHSVSQGETTVYL